MYNITRLAFGAPERILSSKKCMYTSVTREESALPLGVHPKNSKLSHRSSKYFLSGKHGEEFCYMLVFLVFQSTKVMLVDRRHQPVCDFQNGSGVRRALDDNLGKREIFRGKSMISLTASSIIFCHCTTHILSSSSNRCKQRFNFCRCDRFEV